MVTDEEDKKVATATGNSNGDAATTDASAGGNTGTTVQQPSRWKRFLTNTGNFFQRLVERRGGLLW